MADQAQNLRELVGRSREIKVVTVSSGKGGVGKSSITVNLAIALSRLGVRVLIVDADFGLANVDVMLGVSAKFNVSHFIKGEKELRDIIQQGYDGVRFISGGSGVYELLAMQDDQLKNLLEGITNLDAPVDFVLVDTGAGINEKIIQMILASSETIIVTTPEPTAILDAYAMVKMIVKHDNTHLIHVIINKCESKKEAQRVQDGFLEVVGKHLGKNINPIGAIMYDYDFPQSIKRQVPIMVSAPDGTAAKDFTKLARTILELPSKGVGGGVLSKFFNKLLGDKA